MKFKVGKPIFVFDNYESVHRRLQLFSKQLMHHCDTILFIDTINSYSPQYSRDVRFGLSKKLYTQKIISAYDLWDYIQKLEKIVSERKIEVILINALNLVFAKSDKEEIKPLLQDILTTLDVVTKKYNLITVIGNSPSENENVKRAFDLAVV